MLDQTVPQSLLKTQEWFGNIISTPLEEGNGIASITASGNAIAEEAKIYIIKSPTLLPHERIQIYNQQYWWRLLNTLQDYFSTVTRLFGYNDFNVTLAMPYLIKYPPDSWSLTPLGRHFPSWIQSHYNQEDKDLVVSSAQIDKAFHDLFFISSLTPLSLEGASLDLSDKKIFLQPHVHLFFYPFDIFLFRKELLKQEVDHWMDHDFPDLKKEVTCTLLFKNRLGETVWTHLSLSEYTVLQKIQKGITLDDLSSWIEEGEDCLKKDAERSLAKWFKEWVEQGILTLQSTLAHQIEKL